MNVSQPSTVHWALSCIVVLNPPTQQPEKVSCSLLLLQVRKQRLREKPPGQPHSPGGGARIQVQICLPPVPLFFPPHQADPVCEG